MPPQRGNGAMTWDMSSCFRKASTCLSEGGRAVRIHVPFHRAAHSPAKVQERDRSVLLALELLPATDRLHVHLHDLPPIVQVNRFVRAVEARVAAGSARCALSGEREVLRRRDGTLRYRPGASVPHREWEHHFPA